MSRLPLVSVALVSSALLAVGMQTAQASPGATTIAYSDGNSIHTIHSDGSSNKTIPIRIKALIDLAWSRHGQKLAVVGSSGIYTVNANGGGLKHLTTNNDYDPSWSPAGRMLVFDRRTKAGSAILRINADGTGIKRLTNYSDTNYYPAWSPTSNKIAYYVVNKTGGGLHVMNYDGTADKLVSSKAVNYAQLSWSLDGKKIAFSGGNGVHNIYTMNADGSGLTKLTSDGHSESPSWSPTGSQLVFERINGKGDAALYRMNANGTKVTALTKWAAEAHEPDWKPA